MFKKIFYLVFLLMPIWGKAQAHLGSTLKEIRERYPDKEFDIDYTNSGGKYAQVKMPLGTFIYYFNDENITYMCIQIPEDMPSLNAQVEIYNKKYVVVSETSWKAYLDGGGIMKINLTYNDEYKLYVFYYTN